MHIYICTCHKHSTGWILNDTDVMHTLLFVGHSGLGEVVELDLCFKDWSLMFHPYLVADVPPAQVSGLD